MAWMARKATAMTENFELINCSEHLHLIRNPQPNFAHLFPGRFARPCIPISNTSVTFLLSERAVADAVTTIHWRQQRLLSANHLRGRRVATDRELGQLHVAYATYNCPNLPLEGLVLLSGRSRRV